MERFLDIPKFPWNSSQAQDNIRAGLPFVLQECPLTEKATNRWNFEFLSTAIVANFLCDVYHVKATDPFPKFHYWDESKNLNGYVFRRPSTKLSLPFKRFVELSKSNDGESTDHYYLQQAVVLEMGPTMAQEFSQFSLDTAAAFKTMGNWNELTTNLLLCGPPGAVTSCHFDEQQNLFAQLSGRKRVRLFSPQEWSKLYPYPVGHPRDRQAQVIIPCDEENIETNHSSFPECNDVTEYRVDMEPGDVLYIPQYWWHQMEALTENVSLSWWFKDNHSNEVAQITAAVSSGKHADLGVDQLIAIRRNVERIMGGLVGGKQQAHKFYLAIAGGRLPLPGIEKVSLPVGRDLFLFSDVEAARVLDIPPEWSEALQQFYMLLGHVLHADQIPGFILELVRGRFSNIKDF